MAHCSIYCLSICFLFLYVTPANSHIGSSKTFTDVINSTCKQCAEKSTIFSYNFCITSLQAVPISRMSNLQGLGVIAMELALENASSTVITIEEKLSSKALEPYAVNCLKDCLELYADAMSMLITSVGAFLSRQFDGAQVLITAVMEATSTCEEGFEEKQGEVTPLTNENYNLFEISDIALCIINLVSSQSHSS